MHCPLNPLNFCGGDAKTSKQLPESDGILTFVGSRELDRLHYTTPQPHFKPGYTGYTPGSVDYRTGMTYGRYSNDLLTDHRVAGSRLSWIPGDYTIPVVKSPPRRSDDNPHKTLEPHFIPGYTGFTPGIGIRRSEGIGETYGRMTHIKLAKHFLKGSRLRPIYVYPKEYVADEEDVKFYCYEHELTRNDLKRRADNVPGYTGHIPRAVFRHGKNRTKIAEQSTAEFQKILNKG